MAGSRLGKGKSANLLLHVGEAHPLAHAHRSLSTGGGYSVERIIECERSGEGRVRLRTHHLVGSVRVFRTCGKYLVWGEAECQSYLSGT